MSSRSTQIIGGPDREHAFVDTATNALLVKVVNPGSGTGTNVNIAEVGGTAIGSTVPISDGGGSITVDGSLTATFGGLVSAGNATTTPLGSNATYTGTWEDVTNYATLTVTVYANVPSATDGMKFEWSGNGVNIDEAESITISAAHPGRAMSLNVRGRYFRIVYTNGGTAQTTFRLGTVYRPSGIGANNHPITDDLEDTTLAIMTRSIIVGETTGGGGGGYENVKVTPSGALTVEINDGGGSITVDGTVAVSSVSGTVTVGDGGGSLTVDGTVAATQSGAWTVSVNEPVSVDDNGGSLTVDGTVAVSSVGGTVVVGDGGGSLTVDGTVAVSSVGGTVTVTGTVSVNEPVSVDDNGGSLTVDGTVTAAQATHDNLNANVTIQVGDVDVSTGNPVPVSDAGGSLTVDGTVAVSSISGTVTVSGTVSVNEPVSVDDNGGSLTVDGTVAATQSGSWTVTAAQATHDNLNANANIQVGDVDVGNANPVPVSDAGGSLTVDGTVAVSSVGGTVVVGDGGGSITVDGTVAVSSVGGTVTVTGTVSVNEPVSVDDNGGSLTVDGTVAATQSGSWTVTAAQTTHDNLNANANIQVGDADVGNLNPVPVSDAGGSLTVDGTVAVSSVGGTVTVTGTVSVNEPVSVDDNGGSLTVDGTVTAAQATHDNLNLNANLQVNNTDVSNSNRVPIADGGGSITVDGSVSAEVYSSGTGYTMQIYKQGDAPPATTEAPSLLFYATSDPISNPGIADTRWTPAFVDSASGGVYVQVAGGSLQADVTNITPGTGTGNLGKAEDTAHVTGSTGVMPLAVRNDSMTVFAGPNGDYIPFSTDAVGRLQVIKSGGKATYRAANTNNTTAASGSTNPFFVLAGSSTKTVTVQRVVVTCPTLTAVAYQSIVMRKHSTAPTGGTATALDKVPLDSTSAASTVSICSAYTAGPTAGVSLGPIGCRRFLAQATTAAAAGTPPDDIVWDFRNGFGEASGVVLRGTAENISLQFNPAPASTVTLSVEVEWIEE